HVGADGHGVAVGVRHRARAFFGGHALPFGAREARWRGLSRLFADHPRTRFLTKQSPLNPGIERADQPFQYIREMARASISFRPARDFPRWSCRASCRS